MVVLLHSMSPTHATGLHRDRFTASRNSSSRSTDIPSPHHQSTQPSMRPGHPPPGDSDKPPPRDATRQRPPDDLPFPAAHLHQVGAPLLGMPPVENERRRQDGHLGLLGRAQPQIPVLRKRQRLIESAKLL